MDLEPVRMYLGTLHVLNTYSPPSNPLQNHFRFKRIPFINVLPQSANHTSRSSLLDL